MKNLFFCIVISIPVLLDTSAKLILEVTGNFKLVMSSFPTFQSGSIETTSL